MPDVNSCTRKAASEAYEMAGLDSSDIDLVCLGEMGIGNTTISSALCYNFFGGNLTSWVGPGTGADNAQQLHKVRVIEKALEINRPSIKRPLSALYSIGGREQAAICGALLASRYLSIPVILDGFVCTAAVLPLVMENKEILDTLENIEPKNES